MLTIALAAALCAAAGPSPEERVSSKNLLPLARNDDEVVRRIGDVELRASDIFRVLDLAAPSVSEEVTRQMVLTIASRLEAEREAIDVPVAQLDSEVERAIAEQRTRFALEVDTDLSLEEYLVRRHGLGPERFAAEVRRRVLASLLLERAVRLDQLRGWRDELQIMVVDEEEVAREIGELLAEGASFTVLAKRHSIHPSGAEGGFLPPLPEDVQAPLVEGRATLEPGTHLGPAPLTVEGQDVWRFVRLVDRLAPEEAPWADVRARIETDLASHPLRPEELAVFEARMRDRYRVSRPGGSP